jgi:CheY-like chemotaxis protein
MARILIVDDDADVLKFVDKVLSMQGHIVFKAQNAVQAMDLLNGSMYDLLISDANMPHFSGFELIHTVRNNKRFQNMGIAMLTGLREKKDIEKAVRAGVDDYIVKPIDPTILTQKVVELFKRRPPMEPAELKILDGHKMGLASLELPIQLQSFSELGLTFLSPFPFQEGHDLVLASEIFRRIQIPVPKMRVGQCETQSDGRHLIRISFMGINEAFIQKVRAWIYLQAGKKVA